MRLYDNKYLSVTSIISLREPFDGRAFKKWCEKNGKDATLISSNSRVIGEKVGRWIEDHVHNLENFTEPTIDKLEENLKKAVIDFLTKWEVEDPEKIVLCEELNYAGRLDGIIKNKKTGKKFLADYKTFGAWKNTPYKRNSAKIKYARWQTSLYSRAENWKEGLAVVVFKNNGSYEVEELEYDKDMVKWVEDNQDKIKEVISKVKNSKNEEKS